jgi:hypothetical protein
MTSRLRFSVVGLLLAGLVGSAAIAIRQQGPTQWSDNLNPVLSDSGVDLLGNRDKSNRGGLPERLRRNDQYKRGNHHRP